MVVLCDQAKIFDIIHQFREQQRCLAKGKNTPLFVILLIDFKIGAKIFIAADH